MLSKTCAWIENITFPNSDRTKLLKSKCVEEREEELAQEQRRIEFTYPSLHITYDLNQSVKHRSYY